jgi:hypothetical protein
MLSAISSEIGVGASPLGYRIPYTIAIYRIHDEATIAGARSLAVISRPNAVALNATAVSAMQVTLGRLAHECARDRNRWSGRGR